MMLIKKNIYKAAISLTFVAFLLMLNGCALSKISVAPQTEKKVYCELKQFTLKQVDGHLYFNWLVNTNITNYFFLLEKSLDGKTFTAIKVEKGFPSPSSQGLSFS
ncbi:MAG: hypothetical protein H0W84_07215, partial [Bacteroidetes bacterium]|nr:hypothetical protein [Bacteroidota bacterium]